MPLLEYYHWYLETLLFKSVAFNSNSFFIQTSLSQLANRYSVLNYMSCPRDNKFDAFKINLVIFNSSVGINVNAAVNSYIKNSF